jgi:transposase InsO family protein
MRFSAGVPRTAGDMGIEEVLSTPHSPWQRAYVERVIGSIRRECLDHVIVFDERSLRRILSSYFNYFLRSRTHLFPIRAVITPAYEKRGAPPAG